MTPEEREAEIKELIKTQHMTPAQAEFVVALEEGEVDGDNVAVDTDGNPVRAPLS